MGEARPAVLVLLRNGASLLGDGARVYGVVAAYSWSIVQHDCPRTNTSATFVDATVDYHQQSKLWSMGPVASP